MPKVLIKIIPEPGQPEPSSIEFDNAFSAFYNLPEINALFVQVLKTGDIIFAFNDQLTMKWNPETREMSLPISFLNTAPVIPYINIAMMLCQLTGRLSTDAYFMMLRTKQDSPEAFNLLASKFNKTPDELALDFCLRASCKQLTLAQEHELTLAKLNIDYRNLEKDKQVQVKNLFAALMQIDAFQSLIEGMTKDKILSTFFVSKDKLPPGIPVVVHQNRYFLIDNEASLMEIYLNLIRSMVSSSQDNQFLKFSDYADADDYAQAFIKSLYDLEFNTSKKMIALLTNQKANELLSILLNKPIGDALINTKLQQLLNSYQITMRTSLDEFLQENLVMYADAKRGFQNWQQKNRLQEVSSILETPASAEQAVLNEEVKPITPSLQSYRQAEAASSKMVVQDEVSFLGCIENIVKLYQTYACSDASNYSQCIYPGKESEVLKRYKNKLIHHLQFEAQANLAAGSGVYTPGTLKHISGLIDKAKSGCCTTLAIAAAHRLLNAAYSDFRVQMVASPVEGMTAHCFLLVSDKQNENNAVVVDPWLASLGWEGVFSLEDYPFQHYFSGNLVCLFDSATTLKKTMVPS